MKLSVHHIGGRNGTVPPIDPWRSFWPIIDLTLYDADAAAAEMALKHWRIRKNSCASVVVSGNCIGETRGASQFYICFDGSASSMLPFDPACSEYSWFTDQRGKGVYNLGEASRSQVIEVITWPLGTLIHEGKVKQPNILSIDAEGATLQILRGLGDEHFEEIVGLFIEAALLPTHKGEAPLHEILAYAVERNYLCIDFGQSGRFSLAEMHMGAFDRGPKSHIEDA
ncbi:MAG: FkbM family methyltransferase, partial [Rhodospirillaceae bacterium]|nr:FkbM family methyltransferase [Rhodospirillaceae bacterium]